MKHHAKEMQANPIQSQSNWVNYYNFGCPAITLEMLNYQGTRYDGNTTDYYIAWNRLVVTLRFYRLLPRI